MRPVASRRGGFDAGMGDAAGDDAGAVVAGELLAMGAAALTLG